MKLKKRKGMTFIEVLFSIVLLGIISISILPMITYAVKYSKWNNIRQNAMSMAYTQLEWLDTLDYETELELKGRFFPPDKFNNRKEGIVEENLFMNQANTNPRKMDGIEYNMLTNIYWEDGASSTGEYVANFSRKTDVTVVAKDPFSGIQKEYSILGTLIAFEGERKVDNNIPFKIRAFTGHDFTELTKNVKVQVYNEAGTTIVNWGRTDGKGEAIIIGLPNGKYKVQGTEWLKGDMISKPTGLKGDVSNQSWTFFDNAELKKPTESDPYVNHSIFVDYPAYIKLHNIHDDIMNNNQLILKPNHNPPEGVVLDLDLNTNLNKLDTLKIWRAWNYNYSLKHNSTEYRFVEEGTGNLWDGSFQYHKNKVSIKNLTLGYLLGSSDQNENVYENNNTNNNISLHVTFPETIKSEIIIENMEDSKFVLHNEDVEIPYNFLGIEKEPNRVNKYIIEVTTNYEIPTGKEIRFSLKESIPDKYGVDIVSDLRFVMLKHK